MPASFAIALFAIPAFCALQLPRALVEDGTGLAQRNATPEMRVLLRHGLPRPYPFLIRPAMAAQRPVGD